MTLAGMMYPTNSDTGRRSVDNAGVSDNSTMRLGGSVEAKGEIDRNIMAYHGPAAAAAINWKARSHGSGLFNGFSNDSARSASDGLGTYSSFQLLALPSRKLSM